MGIVEIITLLLSGIVAYLKYRWDPEMVKRRDEINKQLAEEAAHGKIDALLAGKDAVGLSYFLSEYFRRVRVEEADNPSRRTADLLLGKLPKRSREDRDADTTEGF